MAKKWAEVAASPEFKALSTDEREAARNQYFDDVVAPNVPEPDLADVRKQFDADTMRDEARRANSILSNIGTTLTKTGDAYESVARGLLPDFMPEKRGASVMDNFTPSDPNATQRAPADNVGPMRGDYYTRKQSEIRALPLQGQEAIAAQDTPIGNVAKPVVEQTKRRMSGDVNPQDRADVNADIEQGTLPNERPDILSQAASDTERGFTQLKGLGYGAAAVATDRLGFDEQTDKLLDGYMAAQAEADQNPAVIGTYKNVHDWGDAGRYATEAVFENAAMFLPSLVSGGFGALLMRKAADRYVAGMIEKQMAAGMSRELAEANAAKFIQKRVLQGSAAGAVPASVGMETGTVMGNVYQDTGQKRSDLALMYGVPAGLLDSIEPIVALRKIAGPAVDQLAGHIIQRLGVEGGKQFLIEAGTEGLQTILENAATSDASGKPLWNEKTVDDVIDSMLKGGIGGGVTGLASQGVEEVRARRQGATPTPTNTEPLPADEILGGIDGSSQPGAGPDAALAAPPAAQESPELAGSGNAVAPEPDGAGNGPLPAGAGMAAPGVRPPVSAGEPVGGTSDTGNTPLAFAHIPGNAGQLTTARGTPVDYQYALVNAFDVSPSQDMRGEADDVQVARIAQDLKPQRLGEAATATEGAPVVGTDGQVEAGDKRAMAVQEAYRNKKGNRYADWLEQNAAHFGFTPQQVAAMPAAMLVRVRTSPMDRADFMAQAKEVPGLVVPETKPAEPQNGVTNSPTKRKQPASDSIVQAIINRGGISADLKSEFGVEGKTQPGLFTKNGSTDLSELAQYLSQEDGFAQIDLNDETDTGGSRQLVDLVQRALGGEKVLNAGAAERAQQAEENAKYQADIRARATEMGIATGRRPFSKIEQEVMQRLEAQQKLDVAQLDEKEGEAYAAILQSAEESLSEDEFVPELDRLADQHEDSIRDFYRAATAFLQGKINEAQRGRAGQAGESAEGKPSQGDQAGGAADGARPHEAKGPRSEESPPGEVSQKKPNETPAPAGVSTSAADDLGAMFDTVLGEEVAKRKPKNEAQRAERKVSKSKSMSPTLEAALRSVGIDPNAPKDKAKELRRAAEKLMTEANAIVAGIPPGQPVSSTRDRNRRERSIEKARKASELFKQADEIDAAKSTNTEAKAAERKLNKESRTAGEAVTSAAKNTAKGIDATIDALGELFGGKGRLSSGFTFDEETYAKAKPLFQQAIAHFKDAGQDIKEAMRAVVKMVLDRFGEDATKNMKPYVVRFMEETQGAKSEAAVAESALTEGATPAETKEIGKEFDAAEASQGEGGEQITHVFDPPAKSDVVRLQDKVRVYHAEHGWMTTAQAKARIAEWKKHAAEQDKTGENANRVVLSLFDYTGAWSQPWHDAGYQVYRFDIQNDPQAGDVNNFSTEFFNDWFGDFEGQDIYAILAACPCTDFASSGARHFAAKDADGRTVKSVELVHQTLRTIEYFKPAVWAIENPVGRIEALSGLPPWRLSFDPNHIGDPYTKKTLLWGRFNGDMPIAPVEPTEGSKMHQKYGGSSQATKNARSVTPEGFAYSFFMANNASDHPVMAIANKYDRLDRNVIEQAVKAGVTEREISDAVDDHYYMDLDDKAANDAIRELAADRNAVDRAAHEAATSPRNELALPSVPQIEANNAKLGHVRIAGLDISIENPEGSIREDKYNVPPKWRNEMKSHYGYIKGTVGKDKDHVDIFVKPGVDDSYDGPVFVIDQKKSGNGHFDEHKVMLGWDSEEAARAAYLENYQAGWDGLRTITEASIDDFRDWLANGDTTKPFADRPNIIATFPGDAGFEYRVVKNERGYVVTLFDTDAKETLPSLKQFEGDDAEQRAIDYATNLDMRSRLPPLDSVLESQTPEDLRKKEARAADEKLAQKSAADQERSLFQLQAQQAERTMGNTGDMFGGPSIEDVQRAKPEGKARTGPDLFSNTAYTGDQGDNNVIDQRSNADLERDRQGGESSDLVGEAGVRAEPGRNDEGRGPGVSGADEAGDSARRSGELPGREAAADGERGDFSPYSESEQPRSEDGATGSDDGERGGDAGIVGAPVESVAPEAVSRTAQESDDVETKRAAQRAADNVAVKVGDRANIDETLPFLLPGQRDDVHFAEQRFSKPDGYGVLFTNGTGTGKTFTGLGIVKRFARQGKNNIIITVPSDKIANDWITSARELGLTVNRLEDTKDAGKGIVITTYANFGQNDTLADRNWDLVLNDEAHYLMQDKDGSETLAIDALRAISLHPRGLFRRTNMIHRDLYAKIKELRAKLDVAEKALGESDQSARTEAINAELQPLYRQVEAERKKIDADIMARQGEKRTRVVFLSATPWAYEKSVDYAEGYLFDYERLEPGASLAYNSGDGRERFFMQHFGYRMRYNKLTEPGPEVNRGLMQRQFNAMLKKERVLSGRMLDVAADYDRKFVLTESELGRAVDEGMQWLWEQKRLYPVWQAVSKKFDHLTRRYFLEAIKAKEVIPLVRDHLAMGRKVVIFHDFKKGGGFNPFNLGVMRDSSEEVTTYGAGGKPTVAKVGDLVREFESARPDLLKLPLSGLPSPLMALRKAFPDILLFNGDVKPADRRMAVELFQDDNSGRDVILVQSAAGKEGISLHDVTGLHQRVLFNLGLPTQPTTAIQQEGRIYRTGQKSNAMFRYLNTGTNWERSAFADTIARRSSTAENLALGEQARALLDGFIEGFENSDTYPAGHEGEGTGGKERDRQANAALTEWDRAMSMYFAQQKKTSRNKAQEGTDYFATPEPLGLKMVEWADPRPGDRFLEPSAGHGAIARWFPEQSDRTVVEPSPVLASRLKMVTDAKLLQERFEDLHTGANKFDVIVMNPPFGVGGKTAIEHLAKAAQHLNDGGRIVALIPRGPAADKRFEKWFYEEEKRPAKPLFVHPRLGEIYRGDTVTFDAYGKTTDMVVWNIDDTGGAQYARPKGSDMRSALNLRSAAGVEPTGLRTISYRPAEGLYLAADITLPTVTFERAATAVPTRVVVIEKATVEGQARDILQQNRDYSDVDSVKELFDRIKDSSIRARAKPVAKESGEEAPAKPVAAKVEPTASVPRGDHEVVEHVTQKGKTIRGIVRADLSKEHAREIDPYTFKKDGGWFIREKYLSDGDAKLSRLSHYDISSGKRIHIEDLNAVADRFTRSFPGLRVIPLEQESQAPKSLRAKIKEFDATGTVAGALHEGTIYLFRTGLRDIGHAEETAVHEATHYGLGKMFGESIGPVLLDINASNLKVQARAVEIKRQYGYSTVRAVEEVLADMGPAVKQLSGWQKLVAWVRDQLRKFGKVKQWTDNDVEALVLRALAAAKKGGGSVYRGTAFSQDSLKPDAYDAKAFASEVEAISKLESAPRRELYVGDTPAVLQAVGARPLAMNMPASVVHKAIRSDLRGHDVAVDDVKRLPELLSDPVMVFKSKTESDAMVALVDARDNSGRPVLVALHLNTKGAGFHEINKVASLYGKDGVGEIQRWMNGSMLYYSKTKAPKWLRAVGLQLPEANTIKRLNGNVITNDDVVNSTKFSRTDQPAQSLRDQALTAEQKLAPRKSSESIADKVLRTTYQALGGRKVSAGANMLLEKLGGLVPETIKAGVESDYGIPEAVTDRRDLMFAHIRQGLRSAEETLAALGGLTRAESRVAYEWMNQRDADHLLDQLPEESRNVLTGLKRQIDAMSNDAIRLGQLTAEQYERNKMAYLHRSYRKWDIDDASEGERSGRARMRQILGDQYKGRGMTQGVSMSQIKNGAPDWWNRKTQNGKADKQLKGEKFIRFERRQNRGEGTKLVDGMEGTLQQGKLLEVNYWPANEPIPAKYGAWHRDPGEWEARDTQGDKVVMWRDFTKAELVQMGEIDEVRYAVAKTLHQMTHDIEVGKYLEWVAGQYGVQDAEHLPANAKVVEATTNPLNTYAEGTWVQVPDTNIAGTAVKKFGKLAGAYIPGPIWNDIRHVTGKPLGPNWYRSILKAWKISKTALSPTVHVNNVMANVVMADWHDIRPGHLLQAIDTLVHPKDAANKEIIARFEDNGGTQGMYVLSEIQRDQLAPLIEELRREVETAGEEQGMIGVAGALQAAMAKDWAGARVALAGMKGTKATKKAYELALKTYHNEDTVFRLAAFIKAKQEGKSDQEAGKAARKSFLDYQINAPWINAMRQTAFPFISFMYRAAPMLLKTTVDKPWKIMKLGIYLGMANAIGYALSGGDEDKERKYLPDEKVGRIWGIVPKLVRMPWNDSHDQPVFLDIRRWIPVGDVFDLGQTHSAVPLLPVAIPGGPLAMAAELLANKSQFTGKPITLDTDTPGEVASKIVDYFWKAFAPNVPGLPGSYATKAIMDAGKGRTDTFGREQSVGQAALSSVGVKLGSYPPDVLKRNAAMEMKANVDEVKKGLRANGRELSRKGMTPEEFRDQARRANEKIKKLAKDFRDGK